MAEVELRVCADAEEAARAAARELARAAAGGAQVALAGGSTPRRAYQLAAELEPDWHRVELWWGDERCVPPGDPRSNYRLAREALLDRLARLPAAVHRIRGERGADLAAAAYDEELRGVRLGLVLLGIGADGHTASLFPHSAALAESERLAVPASGPEVDRVTLTPPPLCGAETVLFLAVGEDKAEALARAFARESSPETPASLIRSRNGRTIAVLDRTAAVRLGRE